MSHTILLNQENLKQLPDSVARPSYDRSQLAIPIVHIGVGGFHRSHEAYYTDALMNSDHSQQWGICGVGLREDDRKMRDLLKAQDFLYTLIVRHPDGQIENRVIGSIVDFMLSVDDPAAVIEKMASAETKIVSLTITEGGYNFDSTTGAFNLENPDVQHDLENPERPRLVFGYLTAALEMRRNAGIPPFTIQSCDNIQHNGDMARKMLLAFAEQRDPELASWIAETVAFPNAMVDRITPATTAADCEYLETELGVGDRWPVTCEPFCQWVIEDNFANGRPDWENVSAQFVPDVTPYEKMKIRLLNAGHSVLGLLGSIHGHRTIDGTIADPLFANYLRAFMDAEATPVLDRVEGINLEDYKDSLIARFGNPNIKDSLARICLESSAKLPKFLISTIRENLQRKGSIEFATLVIAAWCYYSDKGTDQNGEPLEIVDEMKAALHEAAAGTESDPLSFIKLKPIFGDLAKHEVFVVTYSRMIRKLYENPDVAQLMTTVLNQRA
ncbi:MAG: mannitol dehydrogenase family protein [Opitutaceae bacterium]